MLTSICFTLKQFGVPTAILLMPEMLVCMRIIGRTSEGSLMSMNMKKINALTGKLRILYQHMLMDVSMNTDANTLMAGKNRNTTLSITRCMHADNKMCA